MTRTFPLTLLSGLAALASACSGGGGDDPDLTPIDLGAGEGAAEPNLTVDGAGRPIVSWLEPTGPDSHALRFARREPGGAWSEPRTIASGAHWFVNWADFPSVAALGGDTLAAHWLVRSGPGTYAYDVAVAFSADGGASWAEPFTPHTDGTHTEHGFVALFSAPAGGLGAVWLDGRETAAGGHGGGGGSGGGGSGGEPAPVGEESAGHGDPAGAMTLRYARFEAGAPRPLDAALLDDRTCDCCQNDAARAGDAVVVAYRDRSPDEIRDIAVRRGTLDGWDEPRSVHEDGWRIAACPVNGPAVAASGDRVAVAWFTAARDTPKVHVAFSEDGGRSFGPPARIDGGSPEGRVDLQMLASGEAVVTWLERTADGAEVRARRVDAGGRAGDPVAVAATGAERASGFPRFVVAGDELVFAWTRAGPPSSVRTATLPVDGLPPP